MKIDWTELRRGVAETRHYLLSHHEEPQWYRCYTPTVLNRQVRICARCLGVYPGIALGLLTSPEVPATTASVCLVGLLPLPALADWALTAFTERRGFNEVRTLTGALLGYGYGLGFGLLFGEARAQVLVLGALYAFVAGAALTLERLVVPDS